MIPEHGLPDSLLQGLARLRLDGPVAMLLRHAARPPIPPGELGDGLALTPQGVSQSRALGQWLGPRLVGLHTSPVARCVQTAEALREGARTRLDLHLDAMLGAPGAFILDASQGGQTLQRLGLESFIAHLVSGEGALPGVAEPAFAARALVHHLIERTGSTRGLHVFVTHDSLLAPTVARALSCPLPRADWPLYLEAAFFWRETDEVRGAWRAHESVCRWK